MMKSVFGVFFMLIFSFAQGQTGKKNYITINADDDSAAIIRKASNIVPTPRQLRWQQLELTAFFHFGVNTYTDREWGTGKEDPKIFNPPKLNTDQWVRIVKAAGIKQVILTAKHHDGFCLWPTKTTMHSVKSSSWKNGKGDVVKDLRASCKKYNMGFGIYLSPWDMNAPMYGSEAYNDFFVAQLTELLTNYGRVDEVWFDGANGEGPNGKKQVYDFGRWYKLIRKLQPQAVIAIMGPDVRWVGTETGYGRETEWSVVPANNLNTDDIAANSQQAIAFKPEGDMMGSDLGSRDKIIKAKGLVWYPAETDVSIRPGWFYHEKENPKPVSKLLDIYFNSVGRNGVLLVNIPPNKDGLIEKADMDTLLKWASLRNKIFNNNLLHRAKCNANLSALTDNLLKTSVGNREIVVEFSQPQKANVLMLQEDISQGQQVEAFVLEYWNGESWVSAAAGTTIGYKRLLKFPMVISGKFRVRITQSRSKILLAAMGLY